MNRSALVTLVCVFLACVGAAVVSRVTFERLPHLEDEFAYLYQARIFARGDTYIDTPRPTRAYWQPFLINDDGRRFGKYSPGWPLLLAVGAALDQPWIVNAWLAMLTVALVYRLGREIFSPATGAVAALLTAASPMALLLSGSLMAHTAALCFTTLFLYAVWRVERVSPRWRMKHPEFPHDVPEDQGLTPLPPSPAELERGESRSFSPLHLGWGGDTVRRTEGRGVPSRPLRSVFSAPSVVKILWGLLAGFALGMVLIVRPLTAVGIAAPFVAYFGLRVVWSGVRGLWHETLLPPLLALTAAALLTGLLWPAFNWSVSAPRGESFPSYLGRFLRGDDDTNLYLRIWTYDRIGFGEGHGRRAGGHTLKIGWRHARQDLRCGWRDLFGWAAPPENGVTVEQNACLVTSRGYSWVLLPVGMLLGLRRRWTWLLIAVPVCIIGVYMTYWIGGTLYSARYQFEGLTAAALVTAAGITGLARLADGIAAQVVVFGRGRCEPSVRPNLPRAGHRPAPTKKTSDRQETYSQPQGLVKRLKPSWLIYAALGVVTLYVLAIYTPARLDPLRGYGRISRAQIDAVNAMRQEPDKPVVVIVWGQHHWRDIAALMGVTDPHLDSDIVLARDPDEANLDTLLDQWQGREILFWVDGRLSYTLPDDVVVGGR
jgi:hypothetical protein